MTNLMMRVELFLNYCLTTVVTHILFANGGDRTRNVPKKTYGDYPNVSFVYGVGGKTKKNSSSWILEEWKPQTVLTGDGTEF